MYTNIFSQQPANNLLSWGMKSAILSFCWVLLWSWNNEAHWLQFFHMQIFFSSTELKNSHVSFTLIFVKLHSLYFFLRYGQNLILTIRRKHPFWGCKLNHCINSFVLLNSLTSPGLCWNWNKHIPPSYVQPPCWLPVGN